MRNKIFFLLVFILIKVEAQTSAFSSVDNLLGKGRYQEALQELKLKSSTFQINTKIAEIYEAIDNHRVASLYFEKALQLKDDDKLKINLAKSYQKQQRYKKAIYLYEQVLQNDTENLLVKYRLGKLYLVTKRTQKAKTIFQELIEKDRNNANYSYQLGLAYSQAKKRNLKINQFIQAFKKDTLHFRAIEKLARNFTKNRFKDSARIFIDKGLQLQPNHIDLNKLKINQLFVDKKYEEAISRLLHIDSIKSGDYFIKKMLGKSYFKIEGYLTSEKYFKKAVKLDNSDFNSYAYLGMIYEALNNYKKAKLYYEIATFVGKDYRDEPFFKLGKLYYKLEQPKKAIESYKNALNENVNNNFALYELAKLSDDYYKDKRIAYKLYQKYINKFEAKNSKIDEFVKNRISSIKKELFKKGIYVE